MGGRGRARRENGAISGGRARDKGPRLRRGYRGFCPLDYQQGELVGGGGFVERRPWDSMEPSFFYEEFVKQRRPVVISTGRTAPGALEALFGLRSEAAKWASPGSEGTAAMRSGPAGQCQVEVERRARKTQFFGQQDAGAREVTTLSQFCDEIDEGNELAYLTTQALPEDARGCPKALAPPHVLNLLQEAENLRPKLVSRLVPVQYNLWFGRSREGSSSGLHHDFHDNIYVLLRGCKEFRLFSPRCLDILSPVGVVQGDAKLHPNGLISYVSGIRSDGAPVSVARAWGAGGSERNGVPNSDDEEAELDQLLTEAMETDVDGKGRETDKSPLPDSFCQVSTCEGARMPVPTSLQGRHITATLKVGDLLYLPASWFHEVISYGGDAGGHLALNLWMAPPRVNDYKRSLQEARDKDTEGVRKMVRDAKQEAAKLRNSFAADRPLYAEMMWTVAMGQATSSAVMQAVSAVTGTPVGTDPLATMGKNMFDDKVMAEKLPAAVIKRFQECLISGAPTTEEDQKIIADTMFEWARERGAVDFAHWFFPLRGQGGAVGGMLGAYKQDTLLDLEFSSKFVTKPMKACLPAERLFQGETDGSSFPNGGLRVTHSAAAFTTWDRSSLPFVLNKTLYIPCAFITHFGKCIDEKTPLLRSMDAVKAQGLRMLKAVGLGKDAQTMHSYLGWEQEFFVLDAALYKARPDLVNTGRTLFGKLPTRHQQGDLNYFQAIPTSVQTLLDNVQAAMLEIGCPMAVKHNEVAPGQHEMSPVFRVANVSCDSNVFFMETMNREAAKLGLQVLFHEKPFAGINGSGKHANWSVGTDTGLNFFYPGKTEEGKKLYVSGIACLAYGLSQYNELVRCSVATAGNDHRLGAQEAPPAIISLYPGQGFEQFVDAIIGGADLLGYKAEKKHQQTGCSQAMHIEANVEDRNRTAPFPFCGNRFEFRAVGSSQNCCLPVMVCNAIMAAGMASLAGLIEGGMSHRDAVAKMFKENKHVIFTGNGYSAEWREEAAKRGLPNLNTTPKAVVTWSSAKNKKLFEDLKIYTKEETEARQEVMLENYITCLTIEAQTMINMVETGFIPACAKDLKKCDNMSSKIAQPRKVAYEAIVDELEKLKASLDAMPHGDLEKEATYLCDSVKVKMAALREAVDKAETMMESSLYPYPTRQELAAEQSRLEAVQRIQCQVRGWQGRKTAKAKRSRDKQKASLATERREKLLQPPPLGVRRTYRAPNIGAAA
ncbi:glnA3 [Symbiodinium necroappetens]|uniref:GlnA3 protein n=1 Tax=Symbiodinium necroappetens TaxID=1628268 RepID=A0A812NKH9_9DINO|nr:glnA3 [Symbiodinium necroappetens]